MVVAIEMWLRMLTRRSKTNIYLSYSFWLVWIVTHLLPRPDVHVDAVQHEVQPLAVAQRQVLHVDVALLWPRGARGVLLYSPISLQRMINC